MKKTLAIVLSLVLLCTLAIGGTLTYFTDKDFDKNTMTVGKVEITQNETFTDNAPLRPYIGEPTEPETETETEKRFDPAKNAVQKTVTVTNTGSEAAYVRTLFAFEAVKYANATDAVDPIASGIIHADYNTDEGVGTWAPMGSVTVGEELYYVYAYTYKAAVAGSTETAPSLKAIALDCEQDNTFFEAVGENYNILVVSQAVQTVGFSGETPIADAFTAAFPLDKDSEGNHTVIPANWFSQN